MNRERLEEFMRRLGQRVSSPGTVYLTGGATALLLGFRDQTIDIDIKLDPEPAGAFEAIADLKNALNVNVELAASDQFIPPLPGWQERSELVISTGKLVFKNYDLYSQALAKIERGHQKDLLDARSMVAAGRVDPVRLHELFRAIYADLIRYPAIDPQDFERKVDDFLAGESKDAEG